MSESPRDGCNILSRSVRSSARLPCHSSIRRCSLFLRPLGSGRALFLLWPAEHGRSDGVPFLGVAVNQHSSFCFLSLGSQTACSERTYPEPAVVRALKHVKRCWRLRHQVERERFQTCREVGHLAPTAWIWQRWTAPGKTLNFWSTKLWAKEKDCLKPLCIWVACYAVRDD